MNVPAAQPEDSPVPEKALRLAIVGASTLLGKEVKQVLDDRRVPVQCVQLLDDDSVMGQLTDLAGEPAVIETIGPNAFDNVDLVFFAANEEFTRRHWQAAERAGCRIIDLSGALADVPHAHSWIPWLDDILPPSEPLTSQLCVSPHPAAIILCLLTARLATAAAPARIVLLFFEPVSERGQAALDELEQQTVNLLSFQPIPKDVFDSQVAFNLLPRYGNASATQLAQVRSRIEREASACLKGRFALPAFSLVHAPIFHSYTFELFAELTSEVSAHSLEQKLESDAISIRGSDEEPPSPVGVAGEAGIVLDFIRPDGQARNAFWIFGAADNLRLAASNAVEIAERWSRQGRGWQASSHLKHRSRTA
jgi:aspartate-semialdehyde dehydrogenase